MFAHEIFQHLPAERSAEIFAHFQEKEKPFFKATLETLAKRRNLRPVFVERKSRAEKFAWLREALGRAPNQDVAGQILQIWFVNLHGPLLCDFLDALNIPHDDKGMVESLPPAPAKEKLAAAVETLLAKHDPHLVALYLHTFQAIHETGGWPALGELLAEDARLALC